MSRETKYVYFSLSNRQLQLLLAAILRSLSRISVLGSTANELQRLEGLELEAVHGVLQKLAEKDRALIKVILSETQFAIVSIAVKTAQLALPGNHDLSPEYAELIALLNLRGTRRRMSERDEEAINGLTKA